MTGYVPVCTQQSFNVLKNRLGTKSYCPLEVCFLKGETDAKQLHARWLMLWDDREGEGVGVPAEGWRGLRKSPIREYLSGDVTRVRVSPEDRWGKSVSRKREWRAWWPGGRTSLHI